MFTTKLGPWKGAPVTGTFTHQRRAEKLSPPRGQSKQTRSKKPENSNSTKNNHNNNNNNNLCEI